MVECPPIGDRYGAPDGAPPPDEVCSDPEAQAYQAHERQVAEARSVICEALLQLADVGPLGAVISEALTSDHMETINVATAALRVLSESRLDDEIPI